MIKFPSLGISCWLSVWAWLATLSLPMPGLAQGIDSKLAAQYFREATAMCDRDQGRLWGISLCGPMLFADPQSRKVVANRDDREGNLASSEGAWVGVLPPNINIANTATTWAEIKWTMVAWPLPEDKTSRDILMAHELWHRIQGDIGLPASSPSNEHLDTMEGRVWLQLEWRSLKKALQDGSRYGGAAQDALIFRAYRRQLFPKAAHEEVGLELQEGLAEYTGVKLACGSEHELIAAAVERIDQAKNKPTFVRSFAYVSGPAYGVLLDRSPGGWRKNLKPGDDLGNMLANRLAFQLPENLKAVALRRSTIYGGDELRASESERETQRQRILSEYHLRLVDGPVLMIPLRKMNVQFDPNNLVPLEGLGTVYPTMRISDVWGILTVSKGALLAPDWSKVIVSAPTHSVGEHIEGDGWTLDLAAGWAVVPGERKGDSVLQQSPNA